MNAIDTTPDPELKLTKKQAKDLLAAYDALHVHTTGSPDAEAITGRKMRVLEGLGLVYPYETVGVTTHYRLTSKGVVKAIELRP